MNTAVRKFALAFATTVSLAACSEDSKPVGDVLAEDSTLALEVMSANRDSLALPTDDTALSGSPVASTEPVASPPVEPLTVAAAPAPIVEPRSAPSAENRPAPARSRSTRSVANRSTSTRSTASRSARARASRTQSTRQVARTTARTTRSQVSAGNSGTGRVAATKSTTPSRTASRMRGSALIPVGSEFVLAADQRVCQSMSKVGDTFNAHIAEDVVGPIGVVIPKGTAVTAHVSSVRNDMDFDIESLTFAGRTYSVGSDVTYAGVEKVRTKSARKAAPVVAGAGLGAAVGGVIGRDVKSAVIGAAGGAIAGAIVAKQAYRTDRCLPEGGRINAKLSEPLTIAITE